MRNPFADYKSLLNTFSYGEQIHEINQKINELANQKEHANIIDRRYERMKELKHLKNNIINRSQLIHVLNKKKKINITIKMDASLSNYITEINKLSYKDKGAYITKKLISMEPDDITYFIFFKKLQIMLINLPDAFKDFIKVLNTSDKGAFNFGFNSNVFDNYFLIQ